MSWSLQVELHCLWSFQAELHECKKGFLFSVNSAFMQNLITQIQLIWCIDLGGGGGNPQTNLYIQICALFDQELHNFMLPVQCSQVKTAKTWNYKCCLKSAMWSSLLGQTVFTNFKQNTDQHCIDTTQNMFYINAKCGRYFFCYCPRKSSCIF